VAGEIDTAYWERIGEGKEWIVVKVLDRWGIIVLGLLLAVLALVGGVSAQQEEELVISLAEADLTPVGEENGDWAGYFASPAGDVNGDGLGDVLIGAPMAGDKACPYPPLPDGSCPPPYMAKGQGVAYLILGRPRDQLPPNPVNLLDADASFLGCEVNSMSARQLYTAGDVNGDGYDDILISGWKCGEDYTGKAYLFLGRPDVDYWGRWFPVEDADASFLGEDEQDFLSYYVSMAGDVNADGFDDIVIASTHYEEDDPCPPGTPEEDCGNCCTSFLNSAELFDLSTGLTGTWTITGDLSTARFGHTAILLLDDQVLAAGGQNLSSFLNSAELFDPATGTWTTTGSLNTARSHQTAARLLDGQVLVAGGQNDGGFLNSAELFDPATETWNFTGDLNIARSGHTVVLLLDGKVLVVGGQNDGGYLNSAELYDPATGTWTNTGDLESARFGHITTLLQDGRVLVAGGQNDGGFLSSAELYDPATGTYTTTGSLHATRSGHTAALLTDGRLLVAGGQNDSGFLNSAELYDPATGTWTTTQGLKDPRTDHTTARLPDGQVLVVGGQNDGGSEKSAELFDPATETWTSAVTKTLNTPRTDHTMVLLPDGKPLVAGGRSCLNFGKIYLLLGREAADWGTDYDLGQADASFLGEAAEDRIGRSVTGVGDVNGDGYGDFAIGSISSDYGGLDAGQNYLFLGRATEDDPDYDPTRPWWGTNHPVAGADASFIGEAIGDESGRRVADAGDVNGDGYGDILIGAARNSLVGHWSGIAHLILGRPEADWGMHYPLAQADASFVGEATRDQAGRRLSGAGDVNNDGYDDFIIGAPHNQRASELEDIIAGTAYLIYGRPAADWGSYYPLALADVIYVGKPDVGVAGYDQAQLGDFDGDGIDDFLIAAYGGRNNNEVPGDTYVLLGSETPRPFRFIPDAPEGFVREWHRFTGVHADPNGWQDLSMVHLVLGRDEADPRGLNVSYDPVGSLLSLDGSDESCSPGDAIRLSNDVVELACKDSSVEIGQSGGLIVRWRARWAQPIIADTLELNAYLRAVDLSANDSGFYDFGTWTLKWEDLAITKTVAPANRVSPGTPLTYTLTFSNAGATIATNVVITDVIPRRLINVSFVANRHLTPTGTVSYTWLVGNLEPMQGGVITVTGIVDPERPPGYVFTNTATIDAAAPDGDPDNNRKSVRVVVPLAFYIHLPLLSK
jgi:uncharacterized repeat protein (TIGR01451 family)